MNGIEYDGIAVILFLHEDGLDGIQVVAGAGALDEIPDHIQHILLLKHLEHLSDASEDGFGGLQLILMIESLILQDVVMSEMKLPEQHVEYYLEVGYPYLQFPLIGDMILLVEAMVDQYTEIETYQIIDLYGFGQDLLLNVREVEQIDVQFILLDPDPELLRTFDQKHHHDLVRMRLQEYIDGGRHVLLKN